jgi:trigger factor
VDYDVSFEEDHSNPRFAGETVSFHLEVLGVSEKQLPEVDADFAQVVGGFGSVEELRDEIREKLFESKREQARDEIAGEILAEILEDATLEYPDVAVEQAIDRQIQEIRMNLQSQGFAWETYLSMQGKTEEGIRDEIRSTAEQNLRESLLLGKIAEAEEIPVEEEQIEAEIDRMLAPYGPPGEQLRPYFSSGAMRDDIERRIRIGNTLEWLIDMATGQLEDAEEEPVAEAATDAEPSQEEPAEVEPEAQKGAEDVTASSKEEA